MVILIPNIAFIIVFEHFLIIKRSDLGWYLLPFFSYTLIGIVAGNPQVTQPGPHPYPHIPVPATCTGLPVETSPKTAKTVEK